MYLLAVDEQPALELLGIAASRHEHAMPLDRVVQLPRSCTKTCKLPGIARAGHRQHCRPEAPVDESDLAGDQLGRQRIGVLLDLAQAIVDRVRVWVRPPRAAQRLARDRRGDIGQALVLQEQQPILAQAHQQGFDSRHRPPHRWFPNHVGSIVTATGNFWAHGWCHYDIKRLHTRAIIAAHMFCLGAAMSATIIMEPDVQQKLAILGDEASDEVTDAAADQHLKHPTSLIYNAKQERGGTTRLFKVLQTNSCRYACKYCF